MYFDAWNKEIVGYGLASRKGDIRSYYDGLKQGNGEGNTVKEHPWLAANYVRNFDYPNKVQLGEIASLIESHMGQWNYGILPKPQSDAQKFIHLCDYLASRKFLEVNFDV